MRAKPTGSSYIKKLSSFFALLAVEFGRLVYEFSYRSRSNIGTSSVTID
jgi:hypothetical protein